MRRQSRLVGIWNCDAVLAQGRLHSGHVVLDPAFAEARLAIPAGLSTSRHVVLGHEVLTSRHDALEFLLLVVPLYLPVLHLEPKLDRLAVVILNVLRLRLVHIMAALV